MNRPGPESAVSAHAARVARRFFEKRGGNSEVHLRREELAAIIEAALATDPGTVILTRTLDWIAERIEMYVPRAARRAWETEIIEQARSAATLRGRRE